MFNFFKRKKAESLGDYNLIATGEKRNKFNITKVVEELIALSATSSSQTRIVVVDSNQMDLLLIRIIYLLDNNLDHKASKKVVKTSGAFTTRLNHDQAMRLVESCEEHGIILEIV